MSQNRRLWNPHLVSVLERCLSCRQLNKGSKEDVRTSSTWCPFYLGVHLIEVSVEGESSILIITEAYDYGQVINMNNINSNICPYTALPLTTTTNH